MQLLDIEYGPTHVLISLPKEFGKVGAMDKEGNKGDRI